MFITLGILLIFAPLSAIYGSEDSSAKYPQWISNKEHLSFPVPKGFHAKANGYRIEFESDTGYKHVNVFWHATGTLSEIVNSTLDGLEQTARERHYICTKQIHDDRMTNGWATVAGELECKGDDGYQMQSSVIAFKSGKELYEIASPLYPLSFTRMIAERGKQGAPPPPKPREPINPGVTTDQLTYEAETKQGLAALIAAAATYYNDTTGHYPKRLEDLAPRYVAAIPPVKIAKHETTISEEHYGPEACTGSEVSPKKLRDTGKWVIISDPKTSCYGRIFIDCTHKDARGHAWYSY